MKKAVFAVVLLTSLLAAADRRQWRKQDVGKVTSGTDNLIVMCTDPDTGVFGSCPKENILLLYWAGEPSGTSIILTSYPTQNVQNIRAVPRWRWFSTRENMLAYVDSHRGDLYFAPEVAYDHDKKLTFKKTEVKKEVPQPPKTEIEIHYEVAE